MAEASAAYGSTLQAHVMVEEGLAASNEQLRERKRSWRAAVAVAAVGASVLLLTLAVTILRDSDGKGDMALLEENMLHIREGVGHELMNLEKMGSKLRMKNIGPNMVKEGHQVYYRNVPVDTTGMVFFPKVLAHLSNLKPIVVVDPDTYYNVFDPKLRNKTHLHWTSKELRVEVYRLMKMIKKTEDEQARETRNGTAAINEFKSTLQVPMDANEATTIALNKTMEGEEDSSNSAIESLGGAFDVITKRLDALNGRRLDAIKKLSQRSYSEEDYGEESIERTRQELLKFASNATNQMGIDKMLWKERAEKLRSAAKKGDATLDQLAAQLRFDLTSNASTLVWELGDLASKLRDRQLRREQDFKSLRVRLAQVAESVGEETKTWATALEGVAPLVAESARVGSSAAVSQDQASSLMESVNGVMVRGRELHNETMLGSEAVSGNVDALYGRLHDLDAKIASLVELIKSIQANDASIEVVGTRDVEAGEQERGRLQARSAKVKDTRGLMRSLAAGMRIKMASIRSAAQALVRKLGAMQTSIDSDAGRLEQMTVRAAGVTTAQATASGAMDADSQEEVTDVEPLHAQLIEAEGIVDEFDQLKSRAERLLGNLTSVAGVLAKGQSKAQAELLAAIESLSVRMAEHTSAEGRQLQSLTKTMGELKRQVAALQSFRSDTATLEAQLRQQVGDTTEALGILDSKFSAEDDQLGSQFASIQAGIDAAAEGKAVKKSLDDTRMRYQAISHDIDDLTNSVTTLEGREWKANDHLGDLKQDLAGAMKSFNESFANFRANIAEHPPLLALLNATLNRPPPPTPPPFVKGTVQHPIAFSWAEAATTTSDTIKPQKLFGPLQYVVKLASGNASATAPMEGSMEGSYVLPFHGKWTIQYYIAVPKWSPIAPAEMVYPLQSVPEKGVSYQDTIEVTINKDPTIYYRSTNLLHGERVPQMHTFVGDRLTFKMAFKSTSPDDRTHPFVSPAEISVVDDMLPIAELSRVKGRLVGDIMNAETGTKLTDGSTVRTGWSGWSPWRFKNTEEMSLGLYFANTLVHKVPVTRGKFNVEVPVGKYVCRVMGFNYYTVLDEDCEVFESGSKDHGLLRNKDFGVSVFLDPGQTRAVLTWGQHPDDEDSQVMTPDKKCFVGEEGNKNGCEMADKAHGLATGAPIQGLVKETSMYRGYGPDSIWWGGYSPGKYTYLVKKGIKGGSSDKKPAHTIANSDSSVRVYQGMANHIFTKGYDGYMPDDETWYVFSIDGSTGQATACTPTTCTA